MRTLYNATASFDVAASASSAIIMSGSSSLLRNGGLVGMEGSMRCQASRSVASLEISRIPIVGGGELQLSLAYVDD